MFSESIILPAKFPRNIIDNSNKHKLDNAWEVVATLLLYTRVENFKVYIRNNDDIGVPGNDTYSLFIINDSEEVTLENMEYVFKSKTKELIAHEKYIKSTIGLNIKIFIVPDQNNVVFAVKNKYALDLKAYHILVSLFPTYFPTLFNEKPITKEEHSFLESLTEKNSSKYFEKVQELFTKDSFYQFTLKQKLNGFESTLLSAKLSCAQKEQTNARNSMEAALRKYSEAYKLFEELTLKVNGLIIAQQENRQDEEFKTYLLGNKNIMILNAENAVLDIDVLTYLDPYAFDDYENITKHNTYFECLCKWAEFPLTSDDAKLLLDAVFSKNHCLKLRMCANIVLDFENATCKSDKGHVFKADSPVFKDYVPNPHLNVYNCFGQNMSDIIFNITNGDLIGAVECAINAVKMVNVAEDASFGRLLRTIGSFEGKCFVTKDGREMTVQEAVDYLKENQHD